jgi:hypothetical protein
MSFNETAYICPSALRIAWKISSEDILALSMILVAVPNFDVS